MTWSWVQAPKSTHVEFVEVLITANANATARSNGPKWPCRIARPPAAADTAWLDRSAKTRPQRPLCRMTFAIWRKSRAREWHRVTPNRARRGKTNCFAFDVSWFWDTRSLHSRKYGTVLGSCRVEWVSENCKHYRPKKKLTFAPQLSRKIFVSASFEVAWLKPFEKTMYTV